MALAPTPTPIRVRTWLRRFVDAYVEHDLLTYASAISFQLLSSLVPFLMFGFGVLGFLELEQVWRTELGPDIQPNVSEAAWAMMNEVVETALSSRRGFWVSAGFVIALWELSGAIRAVMGALNKIYRAPTRRSWRRRMLVSTAIALVVGACWLAAIAIVVIVPLVVGGTSPLVSVLLFLGRWAAAAALLLLAVAFSLRFAPEHDRRVHWISLGSLLVMAGWVVMTLGFGFYLSEIASYNTIFGSLATVVVLIAYLYAAAVVFLGGVQADALVREAGSGGEQPLPHRRGHPRLVARGQQVEHPTAEHR